VSSNAKVSVIIPVYNAQATIARALQSIIEQTYSDKEIIVINGLSTDGSLEIIHQFAPQITHIISEKDNGVYSAINKGLKLCSGDWVYILGADDYISDDSIIAKMMSDVGEEKMLIFGNIINEKIENRAVPRKHISTFDNFLYWRNTTHQQSVFYHKNLFRAFKFDETYKVLADYDFHLFLLNSEAESKYINLDVAHCTAGGLSKQFVWNLYREELKIKKNRLPTWAYFLNVLLVRIKYLIKRIS